MSDRIRRRMAMCWLLICPLAASGGQMPRTTSLVVTLLGTGTPNPRLDRMGPSTLVEACGQRLLFDVGRATTIRLAQARIPAASTDTVFLTHLHSDHTVGLPDLWLTAWLPPLGGRTVPLRVFGPRGTAAMMRGLTAAYAEDIRMRTTEERLPDRGVALDAHDIDRDGVVFDAGGLRVTAFTVDHGGELRPAYGYRVTCGARSVVLSGDTRFSDNLVRYAQGADVILHEVFVAAAEVRDDPSVQFRATHHSSPSDVATVLARTKPRLGVLTHLAMAPDRQGRMPDLPPVLREMSATFGGRLEVGEDLMRIVVADEIEVQRPQPR